MKTKLLLIPTLPNGLRLCSSCRDSLRQVDMREWLVLKSPRFCRNRGLYRATGPRCAWEVTMVGSRDSKRHITIYAFPFCAPLDLGARKNLANHRGISHRALMEAARRCHKEQEVKGILALMALAGEP